LEKKDIASLLDALCERPLGGEGDALSPELEALCRRAVEVMSGETGAPSDPVADPDRLPGLLAALYAGDAAEAERDALARAAADSAEVRLDSEGALAFLDGLEERLEPTPAHLLPAPETARNGPALEPGRWSFTSVLWVRRTSWRLASAFALLLAAGLSWSIYGPDRPSIDAAPSGPAAEVKAVATSAAPPTVEPLAAPAGSCPSDTPVLAVQTASVAGKETAARGAARPDASCGGDTDHRFAERADALTRGREVMRRAKAARKAEIARRNAAETGGTAATAVPAAPSATPEAIGVTPPAFSFGAPTPAARSSAGRSSR